MMQRQRVAFPCSLRPTGPRAWWGWPWLAALTAGSQLDLWELRASTRARVRREEGTEQSESRRLGSNCKYSHWLPEAILPSAGAVAPPCSGSVDIEAGALQTLGEAAGSTCTRMNSGLPPHICLRHNILHLRNAKSILPGVGARCFCIFDFSFPPHPFILHLIHKEILLTQLWNITWTQAFSLSSLLLPGCWPHRLSPEFLPWSPHWSLCFYLCPQ